MKDRTSRVQEIPGKRRRGRRSVRMGPFAENAVGKEGGTPLLGRKTPAKVRE
jgi:hypothetical protein